MKILSLLAVMVLSTGAAHAMTVDFSVLQEDQGHGHGKMGACMKESWEAAKPTDDQNAQAKGFCEAAKTVVDANKDAAKASFHALMAEWAKYPVSRDGVVAAEGNVETAIAPIKTAVRDAQINILNELSQDQRKAFDAEFMDCIHKK